MTLRFSHDRVAGSDAAVIGERNGGALDVLSCYGAAERLGSVAEIKLAETVSQLEQLLGVRKATWVRG